MINWYNVMVEMQRRQDEMARVEAHYRDRHIMQKPARPRKKSGHIMAELLIQTGNWLVNTGCRLQTRYTTLALAARQGMQQEHIMAPSKAPCAS
jgi:hypothetical protein